ncbi:MFS transporter [Pseudomonadales bacterium]|nr:MFS transporter [Pseudomonadales bacterium]
MSVHLFARMKRLMQFTAKIEPHELRAAMVSFTLVFVLMAAYYILRPVRDAMASDWSDAQVSVLWTFTFLFSFIAAAIHGYFVSRVQLRYLVPGIYGFFASTFVGVYILLGSSVNVDWVNKAFYVWVSVFSLFQVSVFWSFMSDTFNKDQSTRLFGFITTGASIGAIVGPAIPALFAENIGISNLLLIASLVLMATIPLIFYIQHLKHVDLGNHDVHADMAMQKGLGGNPLAGYQVFFKTPFLLGIGLFIFLYAGIGSFVYFELKNLMVDFSREQRTQYWALIDVATNTLTIISGMFITSRLASRFGLALTLALVPVCIVLGLLTVALVPLVWMVVALQIFRRAGNYGITRPAREMLFTIVDRETRFKAKQVIDVVVYRGGDVFWGWSFTALTALLGLGVAGVALVGAAIATLWAAVGVFLGRHFATHDRPD